MKVTILETTEKIPDNIRNLLVSHSVNIAAAPSLEDYHESCDYLAEYSSRLSKEYLTLLCARATDTPAIIGHTGQLTIREIGMSDISTYHELIKECPDYAVEKKLRNLKAEEFAGYHRAYIRNQYYVYGFGIWGFYLPDNTMIGFCGIDCENHRLTYCITKSFRRQGLTSEVCRFVIEHLNTEYDINDISVLIDPRNTGSLKLAEGLGIRIDLTG